jgi:hypothetical protein
LRRAASTAHAAAHIEHQFARQVLRAKSGSSFEILLRSLAARVIELSFIVLEPLEAKASRVELFVHEAGNAVDHGIALCAILAHKRRGFWHKPGLTVWAAKYSQNPFIDSTPILALA